ncbi:MAG: oligopeptide:H+ symporter [Pseudomonadota bacterium]
MMEISTWGYGEWAAIAASAVLFTFLVAGAWAITRPHEEVLGHPKGLYMLFFAEMWERFSFYGMRALLVLYLTKHWLYSDGSANLIYGAYGTLVYITPVMGGWLADKYLGQRKAVLFGAILLTLGHIFMAFEGDGSGYQNDPTLNIFWLALSLIIVGSGFLKANISVLVGQLYPRTDIRRDGAYTIFYMGVNLGAATGVLIAAYLGETVSWALGFGLAGIGMLLGLIVFIVGKSLLKGNGESPAPEKLKEKVAGISFEWLLYGVGFAGVAVIWVLIQYQSLVGGLLAVSGIALLGYVMFEAFKLDKEARDRVFAMIFFILLMPVFWGLFEQAGGSVNLFTDRHVDRGSIPTTFFQSVNPIFIILLAPLFAMAWQYMASRNIEPSTPAKMGLGIVQMGLAFIVMVWGANNFSTTNAEGAIMMPVLFLFVFYLLSTTGELCLSPVGLSAMNRLSVRHMASLMMAAFFFGTAGGQFVAGFMGSLMGEGEGGNMTREAALEVYWTMGLVAAGIGVAVIVVSPLVKKLMHLDTLTDDEALAGEAEAGLEAQGAGIHPATRPAE